MAITFLDVQLLFCKIHKKNKISALFLKYLLFLQINFRNKPEGLSGWV